MKKLSIRFYEELNDFLPLEKRKVSFCYEFWGSPSIKDVVESIGVPHTEIDLIMVNKESVNFRYKVKEGDEVSVYPLFESFDISKVQHLRSKPLRNPKFILDVHLGKLAKYLRMLGFDIYYDNIIDDEKIMQIATEEKRTILTRDLGILKRKDVTHGYLIRNQHPPEQVLEVIERFQLKNQIKALTRCLKCNQLLEKTKKEEIESQLPLKVKEFHNEFFVCNKCNKLYWKGTHYEDMSTTITKILQ